MGREFIELFQQCINPDSCLQREGRSWLLQDNNCKISLRVSNRNSLGFSLDHKGRFLYKYAGSFLEEATKLCFKHKFPESGSVKIPNTIGQRPKTFEIDCLIDPDAVEIKWRDATTDGDHINKEHTRIKVISAAGFKPIRVMFYYPNRTQVKRIQDTLETLYNGIGGEYHWGDDAWNYVKNRTGFDLRGLLEKIAEENAHEDE